MADYDQRNQNVNQQNNACRDINITQPLSTSKIKAEISRQISEAATEINQLELEVEKLKNQLMLSLMLHLPFDVYSEVTTGRKNIEDDFDWLMLKFFFKSEGMMFSDKKREIDALRDKYKCKNSELISQKKHLSNLQNEHRYLWGEQIGSTIASIVKVFL